MAKTKRVVDAMMSGVKTPAQMKAEMAMDRARSSQPAPAVEQASEFRPTKAGDTVGGYVVREDIPDRSSIGASLENYKTLGLQEVPMTAFDVQGKPQYYSKQTREYTQNLAEQINQNKELNPLIVVKDKEGYYILEGGHRFDALRELNAQSFPALVVEDLDGMARGGAVKMAGGGAGRKLANKLLPKVEAPSIMTRSGISELAEYIKNREGGYGLRRVQRAADEIPRLGELYSQDALREAFSGDNARALMTLKPSEFEKYAIPLEDNLRDESVKNIANLIGIRHKGGFDSVPYFEVNKEEQGLPLLPFISGHEGRHRNRALSAAGEEAGLVQFLPRAELREPFPRRSQEDYIEALKREMSITGNKVLPQVWREASKNSLEDITIRRPAIDLPDLYAEGGEVKPPAIFEEAQVPFEEIRRQLGMKSGGAVHMQDGGDPQSEIDRMRLELSNSPVIQATPQTPIQRAIGTLGGYMDRAGQFVSESIEPLAEKHPIKHFLGELLLADSLKSAGTAMQDYTKTSRDITEDQPYVRAPLTGSGQTLKLDPRMLDVAGFAQPVASATTRLVGAGAKKAAPFAKDVAEMASELYMKGDIPGMVPPNLYAVSPEVKPSKVLAPANEQGFYSATEAAALNLQRKSGSGQAFLNDLLKQENVRPDEINAMGLDTFLKGKKDVTAAEVQDFIANNKIKLGEKTYKPDVLRWDTDENNNLVTENLTNPFKIFTEYGKTYVTNHRGDFLGWGDQTFPSKEAAQKFVADIVRDEQLLTNSTKYDKYTLPGGENYREVVIKLPRKTESGYITRNGAFFSEAEMADPDVRRTAERLGAVKGKRFAGDDYESPHWDDPNALAHLRMSDRVTDGKKTLLVDEVQSDWHQAGREKGYNIKPTQEELNRISELEKKSAAGNISMTERAEWAGLINKREGSIPDAPFKDDWYQLALRRAVKEAIDGGYDRVALPTGARVSERFDLSKQIDRIDYNKNDDGTYSMSAIKGGKEVFSKEGLDEKELSGLVGKDVAKKIVGDEGAAQYDVELADELGVGVVKSLTGLDLKVGGKGMKKYYDEVYPTYLKKFGKKYGANVGSTQVEIPPKSSGDVLKYDGGQEYANGQITWKEFLQRSPQAAKDFSEPLHYMEITPAMREAFKTGIHMKRGGKVSFANDIDAMRLALSKG